MTRQVSDKGVAMIARFEGGMSPDGLFHPYQDVGHVWTIGYGHTKGVAANATPLSRTMALRLLHQDLDDVYGPAVNRLNLPLNQNQFDATVSFVFNLGPDVLDRDRSFGSLLRQRRWQRAADSMLLYDHVGTKREPGLTLRRRVERSLFLSKPRITRKGLIWMHELALLRADARKHGWSKAMRIRGRRLKALIARES